MSRALRARLLPRPTGRLWEDLLAANPDASLFQTPRYTRLAERVYRTPSAVFAVECADGVRALLPTRRLPGPRLRPLFVSPGGGLPGGPLCELPSDPERADAVFGALARHPNAAFHVSLDPRDDLHLPPAPERSARTDRFFVLDLTGGPERVLAERFAKDTREALRRAERRGVRAASELDRDAFYAFGALHRSAALDWDAANRQPGALFEACAALASAPDAPLDLVLARSESDAGRVVAGVLVAKSRRTHTCWLAAMDRDARKLAPSIAAYAKVVERACEAGATRLLLGASGGIASIEAFKRSLGAEPTEFEHSIEVRGRLRETLRRGRAARARLAGGILGRSA